MRALTQDETKDTAGGRSDPGGATSDGPDGNPGPVPRFHPLPTEP
jgi:hypothetical protein